MTALTNTIEGSRFRLCTASDGESASVVDGKILYFQSLCGLKMCEILRSNFEERFHEIEDVIKKSAFVGKLIKDKIWISRQNLTRFDILPLESQATGTFNFTTVKDN